MELSLTSPVQYVPRVGPAMAKKLDVLGIRTVYDLLTYIPFRYNDFSHIVPLSRVQVGETVTVHGILESIKNIFTKNGKKLQQGILRDQSGTLEITWFNQIYLTKILSPGDHLFCSGQIAWFGPKIVMLSPEYEIVSENQSNSLHTGRLVPIYPETAGISSKWLRGRIAHLLDTCVDQLIDPLPDQIKTSEHLPDLVSAIQHIHFPKTKNEAEEAKTRLAFEELFFLLLSGYEQKRTWQTQFSTKPLSISDTQLEKFISALPFTLTDDQSRTVHEIACDLQSTIPMNRLLEGDVGSGKTVVAAIAMYIAYINKRTSLLLAPTQILAEQHFSTISKFLTPYGIRVGLITSAHKPTESSLNILVGTHALLSDTTSLPNISLIVIDEQQRFGVEQRALLAKLHKPHDMPHTLTMTATPIPRTIAQTVLGNLDVSVIKNSPKGRIEIKTWVVPNEKREAAYRWIQKEIDTHHTQVFIVCPLIELSESMSTVKAVKTEFEYLSTSIFPRLTLGLLHGRLKPKEKTAILEAFQNKSINILVSTPVVEVGIDIPNATIMVVEAADRFGLSQLHQLRGRVGRSDKQSYCLLYTENASQNTLSRLKGMETIHNGPELAELDLSLRGPGDVFGTTQHGLPNLKVAKFTDTALIHRAQQSLQLLTTLDPSLSKFPLLRQRSKQSKIESIQS